MKSIFIGLMALLLAPSIKAQHMKNPIQTVTELFVSTDQRNWNQVQEIFADKVLLDYQSMNGLEPSEQTPIEITDAWKGILPGFEHTHHQLGNFIVNEKGDKAHVFCYGTASHYLTDNNGNLWIVVGSYDFDLMKGKSGEWKITSMRFNFKYQDGNTNLPQLAIEKAKG